MIVPTRFVLTGLLAFVATAAQPPSVGSSQLGTNYCSPAVANSTGAPGVMSASGSTDVAANTLNLTASDLPANRFGYFLTSTQQGDKPMFKGSKGTLCLSPPIGRFAAQVQNSGAAGQISIPVDLTAIPMLGAVAPGDTYNFQCWYRDAGGTSNFTDGLAIQFDGPATNVPQSDDFNHPNVDANLWTYVDPTQSGCISLVDTGTSDAALRFDLPAGVDLLAFDVLDAPQLVQDVPNADFAVEAKFLTLPSVAFNEQGIIVKNDNANWMRFDFYSTGTTLRVYSATVEGGVPTDQFDMIIAALGTELYLRVSRTGNSWLQEYSFDGVVWTPAASYDHVIDVTQVGLFAANSGDPDATAFGVNVDYFYNTLDSLAGEDAGAVVDSDGPLQYNVSTSADDSSITVSWKTDEPSSSVVAYGASEGVYDLGSESNVALTTEHSVTFDGLDAGTTYHLQLTNTDGSANATMSADISVMTTAP